MFHAWAGMVRLELKKDATGHQPVYRILLGPFCVWWFIKEE